MIGPWGLFYLALSSIILFISVKSGKCEIQKTGAVLFTSCILSNAVVMTGTLAKVPYIFAIMDTIWVAYIGYLYFVTRKAWLIWIVALFVFMDAAHVAYNASLLTGSVFSDNYKLTLNLAFLAQLLLTGWTGYVSWAPDLHNLSSDRHKDTKSVH